MAYRQDNPGGRPRKYASAAERQKAYAERYARVSARFSNETAQTLERISANTGMPVAELINQMVLFALVNRNWYSDSRFVRPLTEQARDDRRRATKFQPEESNED